MYSYFGDTTLGSADTFCAKTPAKRIVCRFLSYTRSATVSVAPVGVPPTGSGCVEDGTQLCVRAPRECFRRDAENCGRDDRAPHFYPRELGRTRLHSATSSSSARLNTDWMAASSSCAPKGFQSIRPPISWMKVSYLGSAR